jgi:hypothetical protein
LLHLSQIKLFCNNMTGVMYLPIYLKQFFICAGSSERCVECYLILQKQSVLVSTNHSIIPFHHVPSDQTVEPLDWKNNVKTTC